MTQLFEESGITAVTTNVMGFSSRELNPVLVPLRRVHLNNEEFRSLSQAAGISMPTLSKSTAEVKVPLAGTYGTIEIPVNELAAASLVVWKTANLIAQTLIALGTADDFDPPAVSSVTAGSIALSLSGSSYLLGGLGLIIYAHTSIPPHMLVNIVDAGGATAILMGVIDSMVNWHKSLKDAANAAAAAQKSTAEAQKIESESELDRRRKELELEKLALENQKLQSDLKPASALVAPEIVVAQARQLNIPPAAATQILDEVLPSYAAITRNYTSPITMSPGKQQMKAFGANG